VSSWDVAANAAEGQDHVLHHTRGFGVALDVLVNYLGSEYGNAFELGNDLTTLMLFCFKTSF
jgi:hypothetical protein